MASAIASLAQQHFQRKQKPSFGGAHLVASPALASKGLDELQRGVDQLLMTFDALSKNPETPPSTLEEIQKIYPVLAEIDSFAERERSWNSLIRYFRYNLVIEKTLSYITKLDTIFAEFALPRRSTQHIQTILQDDQHDLQGMVESSLAEFQQPGTTLDQVVQRLEIPDNQMVDTLAVVQSHAPTLLPPQLLPTLRAVCDNIAVKSARSVGPRNHGMTFIPEDDLRYLHSSPIGIGNFGGVYPALWENHLVAVKRTLDCVRSEQVIRTIEREAQLWFPLKHPNIVVLWGVNLNSDRPYLVMPFMKNGVLSKYIENNPQLPFKARLKFLSDIAWGLDYLANREITHGDLKPESVLLGLLSQFHG
ncbi:hypothetical protein HDU91_000431 [Kappamyces sp. JEL0680]|nr:hypothetical protein HDU91_000431 [Kappamyces sp. JEL0680]